MKIIIKKINSYLDVEKKEKNDVITKYPRLYISGVRTYKMKMKFICFEYRNYFGYVGIEQEIK